MSDKKKKPKRAPKKAGKIIAWFLSHWIALAALAISITSPVLNCRDQNRKWQLTQAGRIDIEEVEPTVFLKIDPKEPNLEKYGYDRSVLGRYPLMFHGIESDDFLLMHQFVAFNKFTRQRIVGMRDLTLDGIYLKLERQAYPKDSAVIRKEYIVKFKLRNTGHTPVTQFFARLDTRSKGEQEFNVGQPIEMQEIHAGKLLYAPLNWTTDLAETMPKTLFRIIMRYAVDGRFEDKTNYMLFDQGAYREPDPDPLHPEIKM